MKSYHKIKFVVLALVILIGITQILIGQIPELPSSKPISPGDFGTEIRTYLFENFFAIVIFIISLVVSILMEIYGLSIRRHFSSMKTDGNTGIILGLFIFVSGIWVLTDSKALSVFTSDYGGILNKNAISFISYVSIMLLPIIFISFLQHIIRIGKLLWIIDSLFIVNLFAFVISIFMYLPTAFYFLFLVIHHALIYFLLITGLVYCLQNFRGTKDKTKIWLSRGVLLLMLFSGAALIVFLWGSPHLYAVLYGAGLIIMIQYMIRLTLYKVLSNYNQSMKAELYMSMAYTDMLTGIKNRNAFINEQNDSIVREDTCCIVMDINKLKLINDTFGHSFGDQLICRSAKIVEDSFSGIGACYRIGGDEFAVICQHSNESAINDAIEKMKNSFASAHTDSEPKPSMSCGYAFGKGISSFTDLFNAADKQMYLDKKNYDCTRHSASCL
ncbi:MAG: GGDEF domain-containing protein [Aristaeellaceae bacterium]